MDDENKLQPNGLWPAPLILSPLSNSTVSPGGFNIVALSPGGVTDSWKIECWGEATDHHGSEDEWAKLEHWVPDTSFDRFGAYFNFKVRYKQVWVWSEWAECHNLYVPQPKPPRPTINTPPYPAAVKQALNITGVVAGNVTLQMSTDAGAPVAGSFTGSGSTRIFTPSANWAAGLTWIKVVQTVDGLASDPSDPVSLAVKPSSPAIPAPPKPASARQILTITGVVTGDVTLQMYTEAGAPVAGGFTGSGATRAFTPTSDWVAGIRVKVVQFLDGVASDPSDLVSIPVKPSSPAITPPPSPASPMQTLEITGVVAGNVPMQMSTEEGAPVEGSFMGGGTLRTFTPTWRWDAGTTRVKVVQTVEGVASDPSHLVSIAVKPSRPSITPPLNPGPARQILIITGVVAGNVTLQISTEAGAPVAGTFSGSGNTRNFTPTADWIAGRVKATQSVGGVASDPSDLVSIVVKPPRPSITPPPSPPEIRQALTITGVVTGNVTLQMSTEAGAPVAGAFTGSGSTRTFMPASDWAAGSRVKVVQTVGGVASDPSEIVSIGVRPYRPAIERPPIPTSPKQRLTITGVVIGNVTLQMSTQEGEPVAGHFTGGGTFIFTPTLEWATGATYVKVLQIVGGVPSYWSDVVSIIVKPSRPAITLPPEPTLPNQALTITGVVAGNVTLRLTTEKDAPVAGDFTGSGSTRTFMPASDWAPGTNQVKVVQVLSLVSSDPSDLIVFSAKPSRPAITPPPRPASARQTLTITDVVAGIVTVQMSTEGGAPVAGKFTGSGANRLFTPAEDWTSGKNSVYVIQTAGGVDSDPSDLCTFTVEGEDRPDAPQFRQPQAGGITSRYPTLKIAGLPGALQTVRFENGATLHEETAGADGILTFTVVEPLDPGTIVLEAKQASGGTDSDWSAPHRFTVKAAPSTPSIEAPRANSETSRYPRIRGTGATGGEIVLRHALDPKEEFAIVDGSTRWNWTAEKAWPLGDYAVQARQTFDGDWSDWTEARSFKVSESRYAIGDATPAIGTPVVGTEQSVLLRIQVISGVSGEVAAGVEVKWRVNGEEELLATTQTDVNGWTSYRYTPETVGKHEILADVTQDNAGVILTELYEVNAVLDDVWAQAAELYLDGERVDPASELVLLRKNLPYKLELKIADDSVLIGSTVTLQNFWGAKERGLTFNPDLGTPLTINKGSSIHWYISTEEANSGFYGLSLASSILPDWELPGRVEAGDLADAVRFDLDGFRQVFGGAPAFPCLGATHTLTLRPQDSSFLLGQDVVLELSAHAADLGVTLSPSIPQTLGEDGVSWLLNCVDSTSAGDFAVWLKVPALEFSSLELPMSLAHNSAEVSEKFGPQQMGGSAAYWRYGIRAVSTFTGLPAGGVPVTVAVTGKPTVENFTARDGWIFISYYDGEFASLTIRNRYGK
ncbi:hypothetical protein SOP89_15310 [Pseudomonas siliginis]|uniref:hypothetical protein n=1 Tax=Pseudomonas siliginis TaxID=2842346 RepID=UPI002B24D268|nr:hypothetical protein [Pseudomonas siliginis]MEB2652738.1 hypothetical protein [Pseudomonas siliginis]